MVPNVTRIMARPMCLPHRVLRWSRTPATLCSGISQHLSGVFYVTQHTRHWDRFWSISFLFLRNDEVFQVFGRQNHNCIPSIHTKSYPFQGHKISYQIYKKWSLVPWFLFCARIEKVLCGSLTFYCHQIDVIEAYGSWNCVQRSTFCLYIAKHIPN